MLDKETVESLIKEGKNISEISEILQFSYANLYYFIRKHKLEYIGRDGNGKSNKTLKSRKRSRKVDDASLLNDLYINKKMSMGKIAEQLGTTSATVLAALRRNDIPIRLKNGDYEYRKPIHSKHTLEGLYLDKGLSMQEIADLLGYISHGMVQQDLKFYKIQPRTYKEAGTLLYQKHPEKRELHRQQFYNGTTGPKHNVPTWIERAFEDWARENNIEITPQFQIRKTWHRYDFHLDGTNILVETDGVFWHSLPEHKARDAKFDQTAVDHGYQVIRITDKEIELYGKEIFDIMIKQIIKEQLCQSEVE